MCVVAAVHLIFLPPPQQFSFCPWCKKRARSSEPSSFSTGRTDLGDCGGNPQVWGVVHFEAKCHKTRTRLVVRGACELFDKPETVVHFFEVSSTEMHLIMWPGLAFSDKIRNLIRNLSERKLVDHNFYQSSSA